MNYSKKTTAQKKADGTYRPDREIPTVEGLEVIDFKPPAYLSPDAKKWWTQNLHGLTLSGHIKESDLTALAITAESFSDWKSSIAMIDRARKTPDLDPKILVQLQRQKNTQSNILRDSLKALGLTSVDRGRVKITEPEEENPFAELLAK